MKFIIILLSIALIFVGIAAIMFVEFNTHEESKKEVKIAESREDYNARQTYSGVFEKRATMNEIDSMTSALNYNFTIDNAVTEKPAEQSKKPQKNI